MIKYFVELKQKHYNAVFEFIEEQDKNRGFGYGNGIYATVLRNGEDFQYLDLRYNSNHYLGNEKTFENWLKGYFGNNLIAITRLS